jgi:GAF domain-containing protein
MLESDCLGLGLLESIDDIAVACASSEPRALFTAVDKWVGQRLRQSLCTVNRYDPSTDRLTRIYSSDPASYPIGGSKDKAGTSWGKQVLHERRIFIGEGVEAIRESFDDHATIQALGLGSVINIPVVVQDTCLGTLNLLMRAETVEPSMVRWAQMAGLLAAPGFLTVPRH